MNAHQGGSRTATGSVSVSVCPCIRHRPNSTRPPETLVYLSQTTTTAVGVPSAPHRDNGSADCGLLCSSDITTTSLEFPSLYKLKRQTQIHSYKSTFLLMKLRRRPRRRRRRERTGMTTCRGSQSESLSSAHNATHRQTPTVDSPK